MNRRRVGAIARQLDASRGPQRPRRFSARRDKPAKPSRIKVSATLPEPVRSTPEAEVKVTPEGKSIVIWSEMSAELAKKDEA